MLTEEENEDTFLKDRAAEEELYWLFVHFGIW